MNRFPQPSNSPLLHPTGSGRVFMNGRTHRVTWETTRSEGRVVVFEDGRRLTVDDDNTHWGHIYQVPDDEFEVINAMTPLAEDEPDPVGIPNDVELARIASEFEPILIARTNPRDLNASDADFYRKSLANSAIMMRRIQKFGDARAAIADALR